MPLIKSNYQAPSYLLNGHFETIIPSVFRKVHHLADYTWERVSTPDHDYLDLAWLQQGAKRLIILSHGLEGDANRPYMRGMAKAFYKHQTDVLAWNYRGCGLEMNQQIRFYHSGASDDLDLVVKHALSKGYEEVFLIGFSMGGNISLKYAGEQGESIDSRIKKVVAFSVPLHLHSSCMKLSQGFNYLYTYRFLRSLKKKIAYKESLMAGTFDLSPLPSIKNLQQFDDAYTAPIHGFKDAVDYYTRSGAISFLSCIQVPTLLINALNDPFLSPECFPFELLKEHPQVYFSTPQQGGHVGFTSEKGLQAPFWSEEMAVEFCLG